jgi:hypothetical protein
VVGIAARHLRWEFRWMAVSDVFEESEQSGETEVTDVTEVSSYCLGYYQEMNLQLVMAVFQCIN